MEIANWGVEISFISTTVGRELGVAAALSGGDVAPPCHYFSAYGYFDLAAIRRIEHLNSSYLVLLHPDITESAPFRFFAQRRTSAEQFDAAVRSWDVAIAVVAKIDARSIGPQGYRRWKVAEIIAERYPDAFVLFGLGFSELLFMSGGSDIATLLQKVGELRGLTGPQSEATPLFSKTTTFPFVSCSLLQRKEYSRISGEVEPVLTISCAPASERVIAAAPDNANVIAKNVFGKNDLILAWKEKLSAADLVKFVAEFRTKWGATGAVRKTTTYLETTVDRSPVGIVPQPSPAKKFLSHEEEEELFGKLRLIRPYALRAGLSDLTLRLLACLRDPQLAEYYYDMANTIEFVQDIVEQLQNNDENIAREAEAAAMRVATTARAAINQRYAALELHPETLAHSYSPLLCDIRTLVAAATCAPHFLFNNLISGSPADATWAGFIIFGGAYSPQWYDQNVLALPPASLFSPIGDWWKLTHEAAHGIYHILNVADKLDPAIYDYIKSADANSDLSARHIVGEQFANWFDWRYIFQRKTELYLRLIWRSWIDLPVVWQSKPQYLARSFAVLLCEDIGSFVQAANQPREQGVMPLLTRRWYNFVSLTASVPRMAAFIAELSGDEKNEMLAMTCNLLSLLRWFELKFEAACGVTDLDARINPMYEAVNDHVDDLLVGKIVLTGIINPIRLHLTALQRLGDVAPPMATEIAYIYSLQNCYLAQRSGPASL